MFVVYRRIYLSLTQRFVELVPHSGLCKQALWQSFRWIGGIAATFSLPNTGAKALQLQAIALYLVTALD